MTNPNRIIFKAPAPRITTPPEPTFPIVSSSGKYRIVKKEGLYHIEKKGWFRWKPLIIETDVIWFWPCYGPAIYRDLGHAQDRVNWVERFGE